MLLAFYGFDLVRGMYIPYGKILAVPLQTPCGVYIIMTEVYHDDKQDHCVSDVCYTYHGYTYHGSQMLESVKKNCLQGVFEAMES